MINIVDCLQNCYLKKKRQIAPITINPNLICNNLNMGKKQKQAKNVKPDIRSFPISKSKTFIANLNTFIKMLEDHHTNLNSRQFICEVHQFIARFREKTKGRELAVGAAKQKIKICRECDGWSANKHMLQCTLCEDYYHEGCVANEDSFQEYGLCANCENNRIGKFDKSVYLTELMEDRCCKCEGERQDKEAFVQCLRCSQRFHKKCYGKNTVVCTSCKCQIDQQLKQNEHVRQATLLQYGCSSTKKTNSPSWNRQEDTHTKQIDKYYKSKQDDEQTRTQPIRDQFCHIFDQMTKEQLKDYKQGLMFAILAKKMEYTEQLIPLDCSLDINTEESLDFGLDHMSKAQFDLYRKYKKQPVGPFNFVFKAGMGYDVVADRDIRQKTLICQYIGEVVTLRRCIDLEAVSKNDSLMELRVGYNSEQTLIIRPEKHTNMARFINGINNSKGTSKANVATVRKLAKGIPTVILYSIRNIRKGESLLYDYNAGNTNCQYDTSNFL